MLSRLANFSALVLATASISSCVPAPHVYRAQDLTSTLRVAILPLANYTAAREAPDHVGPMLVTLLGSRPAFRVVDPSAVEAALTSEPWLQLDLVPPDLVDRLGKSLDVDALLLGSILTYGYREGEGERVPQFSVSLRLISAPGGRVMWSAVHNRDGEDGESVFGIGRVHGLDQLVAQSLGEIVKTLPDSLPVTAPPTRAIVQKETAP
jgi:hypothetical protein